MRKERGWRESTGIADDLVGQVTCMSFLTAVTTDGLIARTHSLQRSGTRSPHFPFKANRTVVRSKYAISIMTRLYYYSVEIRDPESSVHRDVSRVNKKSEPEIAEGNNNVQELTCESCFFVVRVTLF